jgi:hypothetical protein
MRRPIPVVAVPAATSDHERMSRRWTCGALLGLAVTFAGCGGHSAASSAEQSPPKRTTRDVVREAVTRVTRLPDGWTRFGGRHVFGDSFCPGAGFTAPLVSAERGFVHLGDDARLLAKAGWFVTESNAAWAIHRSTSVEEVRCLGTGAARQARRLHPGAHVRRPRVQVVTATPERAELHVSVDTGTADFGVMTGDVTATRRGQLVIWVVCLSIRADSPNRSSDGGSALLAAAPVPPCSVNRLWGDAG